MPNTLGYPSALPQAMLVPRPSVGHAGSVPQQQDTSLFSDLDKYYVGNQPTPRNQGQMARHFQPQGPQHQQHISAAGYRFDKPQTHQYMQYQHSQEFATSQHQKAQQFPSPGFIQQPSNRNNPVALASSSSPSAASISAPTAHLIQNFQKLRMTSAPVSRTDITSTVSQSFGVAYSQPVGGGGVGIVSAAARPMLQPSQSHIVRNVVGASGNSFLDSQQNPHQSGGSVVVRSSSDSGVSSLEDQQPQQTPLSIIREGECLFPTPRAFLVFFLSCLETPY